MKMDWRNAIKLVVLVTGTLLVIYLLFDKSIVHETGKPGRQKDHSKKLSSSLKKKDDSRKTGAMDESPPLKVQTSHSQTPTDHLQKEPTENAVETDLTKNYAKVKNRIRQNIIQKKRMINNQRLLQAQNSWNMNKSISAVTDQINNERNPAKKVMLLQKRRQMEMKLRAVMKR